MAKHCAHPQYMSYGVKFYAPPTISDRAHARRDGPTADGPTLAGAAGPTELRSTHTRTRTVRAPRVTMQQAGLVADQEGAGTRTVATIAAAPILSLRLSLKAPNRNSYTTMNLENLGHIHDTIFAKFRKVRV